MSNTVQFRRSTAILTLLAASIGGGLIAAFAVANHTSSSPVYVTARADTSNATKQVEGLSSSFADIIEKASPSVVNIQSTRVIKASENQNPFAQDPFFRQFFGGNGNGNGRPHTERESGLGSGVIINPSGYILTNNHVVDKATTVKVTLLDKREFNAKVIGADPQTDVAVVKIDANDLPALPLGNSDGARVGDLCFAIGNPFGYDHTVTMGIVSAKGRSLESGAHIQNFIQTDAAINPGNSGGALINARGQLIGMNTAIISGSSGFGGEAGNIGIGFAVPVNLAKNVMDQIIKTGKVTRGYIGVTLQPLTPELAQQFGLKDTHGAVVTDVNPGGPGEKAGLKSGDIITAINGSKVQDSNELTLAVTQHSPGETVSLDVFRNGQPQKIGVTLGQRPQGTAWAEGRQNNGGNDNGDDSENGGKNSARGISVQPLTPDIAQQVNVPPSTRGVVVTDVDAGSAAADSGIGQGDVITGIDRKPVTNVADFTRLMNQAQGNVLLTVNHGGFTRFLVVPAK
jgi:Do/DeqQ family serine protease